MSKPVIVPDFTRDVLESDIPRDVLEILLADRTTGRNILWMTDGYGHLESVFDAKMGVQDEIDIDVVSRPGNKIIRPRVDKSKAEQKERIQKKAEVFTPSWICNNMINELNDDNQNAMVGGPGTICTETYLVVGAELSLNRESGKNLANYLKTRFARFLVSLAKSSQHGTSKTFRFVPLQDFTASSDIDWSKPIPDIDRQLYAKYGLTESEQKFIESMIKPME